MKKSISVSIAGTLFAIEEDAYHELDRYIAGITAHFSDEPESAEIIADIESRIAEQFLESKEAIITSALVAKMIAAMGTVSDFGEGKKDHEKTKTSTPSDEKIGKRLFRNPDDKVLGGVASGIAAYLGIDVVWVRAAFIVITLMHGLGLLLYLILWVAMPEAKSTAEHLEMSGVPVTLETISERIKERVDEVQKDKDGILHRTAAFPVAIVRSCINFLTKIFVPLLSKIIGIIIAFISGIAVLALSIGLGAILLNLSQATLLLPLLGLVPIAVIVAFIISAYIAILIPILFVSFMGNALIVGRARTGPNVILGLFGLWFIALLVGGTIAASYGTRIAAYVRTAPEYQETTRTIDTAPFTSVNARNGVHITYVPSASSTVTVSGRALDLDRIEIMNKEGVLTIMPAPERSGLWHMPTFGVPSVTVSTPSLTSFVGKNNVQFTAERIPQVAALEIVLANASHGTFGIATEELNVDTTNLSWMDISGNAESAELKADNSSGINASELVSGNVRARAINASRMNIGKSATLEASAKNGSLITYTGEPVLTSNEENGGEITPRD